MGADAILRAIANETDRQVETLLVDARAQAEAIGTDARRLAAASLATACAQAEPELAADAARAVNVVRIQLLHRRAQLTAERLEAAVAEAARQLAAIADEGHSRWGAALGRLACEAIAATGAGSTVRVRPADLALVRQALAPSATRPECVPDPHLSRGIVARSPDGRVEVDATLPVRLTRARGLLAERLATLLEGSGA